METPDLLWDDWNKDKSPAKLKRIVDHFKPVIESAVTNYAGQKAPDTVRARAKLLAANAIKSYSPAKGANLKTFIRQHLQAVQRLAPRITDPLAPPDAFRRDLKAFQSAEAHLREELDRDPTDEELVDRSGLSLNRLNRVRNRAKPRVSQSQMEETTDDEDLLDIVDSSRTEEDDWMDAVYHDLPPVDRLILQYRTGYRGAPVLSNSEIAMRLKLSPGAISQRAARIQAQLDSFNG